jgi:hypothetical protein
MKWDVIVKIFSVIHILFMASILIMFSKVAFSLMLFYSPDMLPDMLTALSLALLFSIVSLAGIIFGIGTLFSKKWAKKGLLFLAIAIFIYWIYSLTSFFPGGFFPVPSFVSTLVTIVFYGSFIFVLMKALKNH